MLKVRKGGSEEIPLIQGKEQWLRFAGAAVERYPTPKVRETPSSRSSQNTRLSSLCYTATCLSCFNILLMVLFNLSLNLAIRSS